MSRWFTAKGAKIREKMLCLFVLILTFSCKSFHQQNHIDLFDSQFSGFQKTELDVKLFDTVDKEIFRYTEVTIQGKTLNLVIDTGAEVGTLIIEGDVLDALDFERTDQQVKSLSNFIETESDIVIVPDIQIGELSIPSMD